MLTREKMVGLYLKNIKKTKEMSREVAEIKAEDDKLKRYEPKDAAALEKQLQNAVNAAKDDHAKNALKCSQLQEQAELARKKADEYRKKLSLLMIRR